MERSIYYYFFTYLPTYLDLFFALHVANLEIGKGKRIFWGMGLSVRNHLNPFKFTYVTIYRLSDSYKQ